MNCHYCGRSTWVAGRRRPPERRDGDRLTADHVIPRCRGGEKTVDCCLRCNQAKNDAPYEDFKAFADLMLRGRKTYRDAGTAAFAFNAWLAAKLFS